MKGKYVLAIVISFFILLAGQALAADKAQTTWLKTAGLGEYTPATQDWKAIEKAAKKEGKVVIYSLSSRIFNLQEEFKKKYGIEIVAFDLSSGIQLERFRREHKAGRYTVDVLFNRDIPVILNEFLPKKLVWNFVPANMAPLLDADEKQPILIQRWSSRVVFYNQTLNPDKPPVNSLWDLTRKEWEGKVLLPDPLTSAEDANMFQTILQHPAEMAASYRKEFGNAIVISDELKEVTKDLGIEPDAAKEWLHRVLKNKPIFIGSTTTVFKNIGDVKQKNPPVGITTYSKIRSNKEGVLNAQPVFDLEPVAAVSSAVTLLIADRAPHPNAAKLLIRYMMEDGFKPWDVQGDYAARSDVMAEQVSKYGGPSFQDLSKWIVDPDYINDTKYEFLQLFINLR
ncbi:MAG: ABC transporter substrate-binding protein [Desulfobacteraceae bacterium]|nr:ABC transporter substrate-binding protein [Desulfobacteraceae bacterium]